MLILDYGSILFGLLYCFVGEEFFSRSSMPKNIVLFFCIWVGKSLQFLFIVQQEKATDSLSKPSSHLAARSNGPSSAPPLISDMDDGISFKGLQTDVLFYFSLPYIFSFKN